MVKRSDNKRRKKIVRIIFAPLLLISIVLFCFIIFSPYRSQKGYDYQVIRTEIEINAPVDSVFNYLGSSANASEWSVYVSKIEPLNDDKVADGEVGCRRRVYGREDTTVQWDELTTVVEKNKRRQLTIYNLKNFPVMASGLATEQNYFPVSANKTRLVFTVFYIEEATFTETFKTYFSAYKIKSVFEQNLSNIKLACEGKNPKINP